MKQIHGGDVYRHKNVIDFSANTNPLSGHRKVLLSDSEKYRAHGALSGRVL